MTKYRASGSGGVDWTHLIVRILLMGVAGIVMAPRITGVYHFVVDHSEFFYTIGPVLFFAGLAGQKSVG